MLKTCCVFGLGYIGLPTAIVLAKSGFFVRGVDIKENIVLKINQGKAHFDEPGLEELLSEVIKNKSFKASLNPCESDIFIIAVPTPINENFGKVPSANLKYVFEAAKNIGKFIRKGNTVIIESTSPVGTTDKVLDIILNESGLSQNDIYLSYCPERVLPGRIIHELENNNRIIGGINSESANKTLLIYQAFCKGEIKLTDAKTAELVKLSENSYRDVNLAFANELSIICDRLNINVFELIKFCNLHPRVNILNPGCGVGGHCIAIDPLFIVESAPDITPLIQTARKVNQEKIIWVTNYIFKCVKKFKNNFLFEPTIGLFGLTFKPDVDDIRESPAIKIFNALEEKGLNIIVSEPNLDNFLSANILPPEIVRKKADILVILVGHKEFKCLNFENKYVLDFCGISNKKLL